MARVDTQLVSRAHLRGDCEIWERPLRGKAGGKGRKRSPPKESMGEKKSMTNSGNAKVWGL